MTNYKEILRLYYQGISQRSISTVCECSRNTVSKTINAASTCNIAWEEIRDLSNEDILKKLFPERIAPSSRRLPDCEYLHKEMAKSGVTLSLLWTEYCETCRESGEVPFMYSQFCNFYRTYTIKNKATMHIHHKPGEKLEVDWAGQTAVIINTDTGEPIKVYIFVAVLPSSQYAYVEAFFSQNQENWITAHVNAYKFFGGVTRILVPDNLKTGVDKTSWFSPVINKSYNDMAEYYGTVVIPTRVRKPKDKANVEGAVGVISTWILAAIRRQQFFSLHELNKTIKTKLLEFNNKPFQKKPGSRYSTFITEERSALLPLPSAPYELASCKIATVQFNYHITIDKMHYSVPYEYIKHKVDVRITKNIIEVFFNNHRICSHTRFYGKEGQYNTIPEHMPRNHQEYITWNSERFISWAKKIGPSTSLVVDGIFSVHKIEQQAYKSCMALLKLGDKYSVTRLELACERALTYTKNPSYKSIQTIIKYGQDKAKVEPIAEKNDSVDYGFTRGADYYRRNQK